MSPGNKHIVLMNATRAWGGGEKWHFETAMQLQQQGFTVTMVCHPASELHNRCQQAGIPVKTLAIRNLSYLNLLKLNQFSDWLKECRPDAIILNSSTDLKFGGIAAGSARVPSIIYRRGSAIPLKNHLINRLLFKNIITGVIANSLETARTINQNHLFVLPEKIQVIYNGIDFSALDDGSDNHIYQRQGEEFVIGHAGRFAPQKNQDELITMADLLRQQEIPFKLLIAGSGPLGQALKARVARLGLSEQVVFLDFVEDMASFYRSIDLFVLPSKWEGFGYVLAEALYFEKPVVAYRISSNPEIVQHNKSGYLVDCGHPEQLADAVGQLYQHKINASRLGEFGKQDVISRFSKDKNFQLLLDFLGLK